MLELGVVFGGLAEIAGEGVEHLPVVVALLEQSVVVVESEVVGVSKIHLITNYIPAAIKAYIGPFKKRNIFWRILTLGTLTCAVFSAKTGNLAGGTPSRR